MDTSGHGLIIQSVLPRLQTEIERSQNIIETKLREGGEGGQTEGVGEDSVCLRVRLFACACMCACLRTSVCEREGGGREGGRERDRERSKCN